MRIALFSDIHANAVALRAFVADVERRGVERLVCLGDTIQGGPQPRETVELLRDLACPVVLGNADWFVLTGESAEPTSEETERVAEWTRAQLDDDATAFIRALPHTVELDGLLAFHATPTSLEDVILVTTPYDELDRLLGDVDAPVLAGGHTHHQLLRRRGSSHFVNPGSVGLSYDHRQPSGEIRFDHWAQYAIVDGLSFEFHRVPFDGAEVVRAYERSGAPADPAGWR